MKGRKRAKTSSPRKPLRRSTAQWTKLAEAKLKKAIDHAYRDPTLRKRVRAKSRWSISLLLQGTAAMTRLNAAFRGKSYPTDVLSFPAPEIFRTQGLLGELVICLPVLRRQAKDLGHPPERELEVLLVHGLLHLLSFDHEKNGRQAAQMLRWENRLLKAAFSRKSEGLIERAG